MSIVADPYRVFVTPPVALRIARCVELFIRTQGVLTHWESESRAVAGGGGAVAGAVRGGRVWRRLTVRFNSEGDVLVVTSSAPEIKPILVMKHGDWLGTASITCGDGRW